MKINKTGNSTTEITLNSGTVVLVSYSTAVACKTASGERFKTEAKWSVTTSKHITQFFGSKDIETKPQSYFDELLG